MKQACFSLPAPRSPRFFSPRAAARTHTHRRSPFLRPRQSRRFVPSEVRSRAASSLRSGSTLHPSAHHCTSHLAVLPGNPIVALSGNVATAGTTTARRPAPYGGQRPGDDLAAVAAALHEVPRSARSLGRFVRSDPTHHRAPRATSGGARDPVSHLSYPTPPAFITVI